MEMFTLVSLKIEFVPFVLFELFFPDLLHELNFNVQPFF